MKLILLPSNFHIIEVHMPVYANFQQAFHNQTSSIPRPR